MASNEESAPLLEPQEEFIRACFARVCRLYWGVALVQKLSWGADNVCRVKVSGLHPELRREFEERVARELDATGYSLLGSTANSEVKPPTCTFEIRSRLVAAQA
jgi:hypothetical protein